MVRSGMLSLFHSIDLLPGKHSSFGSTRYRYRNPRVCYQYCSQAVTGKFKVRFKRGCGFQKVSKKLLLAPMELHATESFSSCMNVKAEFEHEGNLLREFYDIPSIDKAYISQNCIAGYWQTAIFFSQQNLSANKKKTFVLSAHVPVKMQNPSNILWSNFPTELIDASLVVPSPSGNNILVVRNGDSSLKNTSPIKLEIWGPCQLRKEIFVAPSVHGSLYNDGWFEGVSWSPDEKQIAYIAEEPPVPKYVFTPSGCKSGTSVDKEPGSWSCQGDWSEDWGETYAGKRRPSLFVVNISSGIVNPVKGVPKNLSVGQVVWAPKTQKNPGSYLVFVGWSEEYGDSMVSRKLGMKYCYNRHCALYAVRYSLSERTSSEDIELALNLTKKIDSAFLPRFSPDGRILAFLSANTAVKTGVHCSTNSLHTFYWPSDGMVQENLEIHDVVPIVKYPGKNLFPGLYCTSLLSQPWLSDGQTLLLNSIWGSLQVVLAVDVISGNISRITPHNSNFSWTALAVRNDVILAVSSSPTNPPTLMHGRLPNTESLRYTNYECYWLDMSVPFIDFSDKVKTTLSSMTTEILKVPVKSPELTVTEGAKQPFEAIFVSTKVQNDSCNPLIVVIHGGPHSTSLASFSRTFAFLSSLGFNLLFVNYRGSLGFGEDALQSLPGNIGVQDVSDVLVAIDLVIEKGYANPAKIGVLGGSHGGFLTTHLIGQAPEKFVAAATRNPVCNISLMIGTTDIPDWCYVEAFGQKGKNFYSEAPSVNDLTVFHQKSPIAYISKVKTPVLMLLGAEDLRVPISNGLQYAHALKENGVEVKIIVFPNDMHGIDRPQSDFESFLNIGVWFKRFLK